MAQSGSASALGAEGSWFKSRYPDHTAKDLDIKWKWKEPAPIRLAGFKRALKKAWKKKFGDKCIHCEREMVFFGNPYLSNYATIDHVVARAFGGSCGLENIQVICLSCNGKKGRFECRGIEIYPPLITRMIKEV